MRSSSVSRVMPALLQRMPTDPSLASMSASSASIDSWLHDVEHRAAAAVRARALADARRALGRGRRADDAGAVGGEPRGDGRADAARSAGHQSNSPLNMVGSACVQGPA
jgi:hypothetical protein